MNKKKKPQTGSIAHNFYQGTRSEYLAQYVFSAFGTSIPVPHPEDSGIDLYCTLGEVAAIKDCPGGRGMNIGLCFDLKTAKETISIHLGPQWYLDKQTVKVNKGDKLEVKGSKVKFNKQDAIIAVELSKGKEILKLRDAGGYPLWSKARYKK